MATHKRPRGVSVADMEKCQRIGHSWDDEVGLPPAPERGKVYMWRYRAMKRCERCTTVDVMGLNDKGDVISHSYDWPEGYKHAKDDPRPTRSQLRLAFIRNNRDIIIRNRRPYKPPVRKKAASRKAPRRRKPVAA